MPCGIHYSTVWLNLALFANTTGYMPLQGVYYSCWLWAGERGSPIFWVTCVQSGVSTSLSWGLVGKATCCVSSARIALFLLRFIRFSWKNASALAGCPQDNLQTLQMVFVFIISTSYGRFTEEWSCRVPEDAVPST